MGALIWIALGVATVAFLAGSATPKRVVSPKLGQVWRFAVSVAPLPSPAQRQNFLKVMQDAGARVVSVLATSDKLSLVYDQQVTLSHDLTLPAVISIEGSSGSFNMTVESAERVG